MPAESKAQRRLMGACEHGADYPSCPKDMTKSQMHDFAATKEKGLPEKKLNPCSPDAPTVCGREAAKKKRKGFQILIAVGKKK